MKADDAWTTVIRNTVWEQHAQDNAKVPPTVAETSGGHLVSSERITRIESRWRTSTPIATTREQHATILDCYITQCDRTWYRSSALLGDAQPVSVSGEGKNCCAEPEKRTALQCSQRGRGAFFDCAISGAPLDRGAPLFYWRLCLSASRGLVLGCR